MRPCVRGPGPDFLRDHGSRWSMEWKAACEQDGSAPIWAWSSHAGKPVNLQILPDLIAMTHGHCSYCDGHQLTATGRQTIDHFRPKSRGQFPGLAFVWDNLFLACDKCQEVKRQQFDEQLLRPDDPLFSFDAFFTYREASGDLDVNPASTHENQQRAIVSIRIFGLNRDGRPQARKRALKIFRDLQTPEKQGPLDDWPYRFLMEFNIL